MRASTSAVGDDRDPEAAARALLAGQSILVAGPFGSGKSFLLRSVGADLSALGSRHLVVHGSSALAATEYGALRAAGGGDLLEEDAAEPSEGRRIVVVDDAHLLDEPSAALLARLVVGRRIAMLAGVTVPRSSNRSLSSPARTLLDLWTRGQIERVDLRLLDEREALDLIDLFDVDRLLGLVTRRALLFLCAGSRSLLRELTTESVAAKRAGVDPLVRMRELSPWSRLDSALASEVDQFSDEECLALAVLDALRGIGLADARLLMRPGPIADLLDGGAVRDDGTTDRRLFANPLLAKAAARRIEPSALEDALSEAARLTVSDWHPSRSESESANIVSHWQAGKDHRPEPDELEAGMVNRLLVDAARDADRHGRYDLEAAYARLGEGRLPEATAAILRSRSLVGARDEGSAVAALVSLDPASLDPADRRRVLRWALVLRNRTRGEQPALRALIAAVLDAGDGDEALLGELRVADAELLALQMDWPGALAEVSPVVGSRVVSTVARGRATLLTALGSAYTGDWTRAEALFRAVELGSRDAVTGRTNDVLTASWCLCFETLARVAVGADLGPVEERLAGVIDAAVLQDNRAALCITSMTAGSLAWQQGRFDDAVTDYAATALRCDLLELAIWRPIAMYSLAIALQSSGRHEAAMRALARADLEDRPHRLHEYTRALAASSVLLSDGDRAGAQAAVALLVETSSHGTPTLESRDRFMLSAMTGPDAVAAERMLALLDTADLPLTRALAESVTAQALDDPELADESERHLGDAGRGWQEYAASLLDARPSAPRPVAALRMPARPPASQVELTERELEIARLVAQGLSNKQIAADLFLSVRTVESHVYQARLKLSARTRRELGRIVMERSGADELDLDGGRPVGYGGR